MPEERERSQSGQGVTDSQSAPGSSERVPRQPAAFLLGRAVKAALLLGSFTARQPAALLLGTAEQNLEGRG